MKDNSKPKKQRPRQSLKKTAQHTSGRSLNKRTCEDGKEEEIKSHASSRKKFINKKHPEP